MRVGLISALYPPLSIGGAELMAAQLAEGLYAQGAAVEVLSLQPPPSPGCAKVDPQVEPLKGPRVSRLALRNLYWPYDRAQKQAAPWKRLIWHIADTDNPLMRSAVRDWAERVKPEMVCTQNLQGFSTGIWAALADLKIPVVHVLHDFSLLCPRTILFRDGRSCGHQKNRCRECRWLTAPRARHTRHLQAVVGVSQSIVALHQQHGLFTEIPTSVIYNALDDTRLMQPLACHADPLPALASTPAVLRLGFLGRLDTAKGIDVLLAAARLLQATGTAVRLVLGGRGQDEDVARWQAEYVELDVQWRGHIDPATLWPDIDVLVFPSTSLEALGNVVLEAAAAGRPSVCSRHGGAPELIEPGITGACFAPGNVAELAEVLRSIHADPTQWARMGRAAHARAQVFTAQARAAAYLDLFEKVVHEHRTCTAR